MRLSSAPFRNGTGTIPTVTPHPLRQAEDAVLLDTTALDFVQSEDALLHIIRERTGL